MKPLFKIGKIGISYTMEEIRTSFDLEESVFLNLPNLFKGISYNCSINSKLLDLLKYEIKIKNGNISSPPFDLMYVYQYPTKWKKTIELSFTKDGNDLRFTSSFLRITHSKTEKAQLIIKPKKDIELLSVRVDIIEANYLLLTEKVEQRINHVYSNNDYFFVIDVSQIINKKNVSVNIELQTDKDISPFNSIFYYKEFKANFDLKTQLNESINFTKKDKKLFANVESESANEKEIYHFDVLLLNIISNVDLDDFRIKYEFFERKDK